MFILRVQSSYLIFTKKCHTANNMTDGSFFLSLFHSVWFLNVSLKLLEAFK